MKKTLLTSKNRDELKEQMEYLKSNYQKLHMKEKELCLIWFDEKGRIKVAGGRTPTYWELDFGKSGEITVKSCWTFIDWLQMGLLVLANMIIVGLVIWGGGLTLAGLLFLLVYISVQVVFWRYIYVTSPLRTITRFVKKYLGVYE